MPIITIDALEPTQEQVEATLPRVATAVAAALGVEPATGVRAYFRSLTGNAMAAGGDVAIALSSDTHPPTVTISAIEGRDPELIEAAVRAAATEVEAGLGLELGNVFVTWHDYPRQRTIRGGDTRR